MKITDELLREVDINEDDLDLEIQRQPAKFCFWGARFARAIRRHAREKLALHELRAQVGKTYRNRMAQESPQTRVTNDMVDTFVTLTPEYQEQTKAVAEAEYQENLLSAAKEAFRQRSQMLLQLARMKMDEMIQSDYSINKRELEGRKDEFEKRHSTDGILGGRKSERRDRSTPGTDI